MNPLAACLAVAFAVPALADEIVRFDPLVITGSRVEQSIFDLPAAVDVVDAARIGAAQARVNASEALAGVPGIVVQNRQNYAQDLQISSRGFGARTAFGVRGIRLVADGIPASMPDGQGQAATFNLDRAERIEVMRGPLSSVYGNAAGGVIQLFTPDGKGRPSVEGRFSAGSNSTRKGDLSSQGEVGGLAYVVDASRFVSDGYRDHSAVRRDQGLAKLAVSPSPDGRLTLVVSSFRQIADDPLGLDWAAYQNSPEGVIPNALNFNTRKRISQQQGGLNYEHRFGEHTLQLSTYAGERSVIQYQAIPVGSQANPRHAGGVIDFERSFAGTSARWIVRNRLPGGRLTMTFGADYERSVDDRQGFENFIGTTLGVKGRLRRDETDRVVASGFYVQSQWQGERWNFSGGLRHTRVGFKVSDHYVVAGNGDDSGSVGNCEQLEIALKEEGLSEQQARDLIFLADRDGIITSKRAGEYYLKRYAKDPRKHAWLKETDGRLADAIRHCGATVYVSTSGEDGCIEQEIARTMQANAEKPVIISLYSPAEVSEKCVRKIYEWTEGKALVVSGSPLNSFEFQGNRCKVSQGNNILVFPGVGLGVLASGAREVRPEFFTAAARAVADHVSRQELERGQLLPVVGELEKVCNKVALAVAMCAVRMGVSRPCVFSGFQHQSEESRMWELITRMRWLPQYLPIVPM